MPITSEDYLKKLSAGGTNSVAQSTQSQPAKVQNYNSGSMDTYDLQRMQNYKGLADTEIQLMASKQAASKQTQSMMAANGFGGTGYSSMGGTAINNQYINALANANVGYNQTEANITQAESDASSSKSSSNFQALTSLMGGATTTSDLNGILANDYQFGTVDDKGNFTWNDKALTDAGYTTDDIRQLKSTYTLFNNQLSANELVANKTINGTGYNDYQTAISSGTLKTNNGASVDDKTWGLKSELNYLFNQYTPKGNGDVVKLENGHSDKDYIYMVYQNGKWYQTNSSIVDTSSAKVIKGGQIVAL